MIKSSLIKVWNKLWSGIRTRHNKPKAKSIYAISDGKYRGEFFVYMERIGDTYSFLSLPDLHIRHVPVDNFEFGLNNDIIEKVESLPSGVHSVCHEQYIKLTNNRGTGDDVPSKQCSDT